MEELCSMDWARHRLDINRPTLILINGQVSENEPINHLFNADLPYIARKLAPVQGALTENRQKPR